MGEVQFAERHEVSPTANILATIHIRQLAEEKITNKPLIAKMFESARIMVRWDLLHSKIVFENAPENWNNVDPILQSSIDLSAILRHANHRYSGVSEIAEIVASISYDNVFHPVRDFLLACEREYAPSDRDYIKEFFGLLDIENDTEPLRELLKKWVLGMALLPFNNGEKGNILTDKPDTGSHIVPLFIGKQGIGKGSWLRRLATNPIWYTDNAPIDFNKPYSTKLACEYWLTELSEVDGITKKEQPQLKAFLTAAADTVHINYSKSDNPRPRTTAFAATSNLDTPLRDITGNRRFLIIKLQAVDTARLFDPRTKGYITDEFMRAFWGQAMFELRQSNFAVQPTKDETGWLLEKAQIATATCEGEEELISSYDWSITDKTKWTWKTANEITKDIKVKYPFAGFTIKSTTITRVLIPKLQSANYGIESKVDRHSRLTNYLMPPRQPPPA